MHRAGVDLSGHEGRIPLQSHPAFWAGAWPIRFDARAHWTKVSGGCGGFLGLVCPPGRMMAWLMPLGMPTGMQRDFLIFIHVHLLNPAFIARTISIGAGPKDNLLSCSCHIHL
jgi:hypothetical protein